MLVSFLVQFFEKEIWNGRLGKIQILLKSCCERTCTSLEEPPFARGIRYNQVVIIIDTMVTHNVRLHIC